MGTHRKEKVASVIRDIVSNAIAHRLNDPRIDPMTTVTRVEVTRDLVIAEVFVTVPGADSAERLTLTAIRHAGGYIQRLVASELSLRLCPQVRFKIDEGAKGAQRTMEILAENRRRHPEVFSGDQPVEEVIKQPPDNEPLEGEAHSSEGAAQ